MFELITAAAFDVDSASAKAVAYVPADHPMFADHFPGHPTLPGSIAIELAAQIAGPLAEMLVAARHESQRWAALGMVRHAKLVRPTSLPATLEIAAHIERLEPSAATARVATTLGGERVLSAELVMVMFEADNSHAEAIRQRRDRVDSWIAAWPAVATEVA